MLQIMITAGVCEGEHGYQVKIAPRRTLQLFGWDSRCCDGIVVGLSYALQKPIASPGHGFDILRAVNAFTQRLSEREYALRKIAFLDKLVWPNLLHEDVLLNHMSLVSHQHEKCDQGLRR